MCQSSLHFPSRMLARLMVVAAIVGASALSHAGQIIVVAPTDAIALGDGCSIREAIINANTDSKSGSTECARGDGDDIVVLPPKTITFSSDSALDVSTSITVLGGSGAWTILDGRWRSRVFDVLDGGALVIRGVQLKRGHADDEGGAIRVRSGGVLSAEYLVVTMSRVIAEAGRGGGIFLASGSIATVSRSEISYNDALGASGVGGGLYCASGCRLKTLETTTITGNKAGLAGGGLYIAGDARSLAADSLGLSFVTVGYNSAASGAGILLSGQMSLFALMAADNGAGGIGADLECAGSAFSLAAAFSFAEMPGVGCTVTSGMLIDRALLPPSTQSQVLYDATNSGYQGAPGRTHRIMEVFFSSSLRPVLSVPAVNSRCGALVDQHGRSAPDTNGDGAPDRDCDLGAFQAPMLSIWTMGVNLYAADDPLLVSVHLADPHADEVHVQITPAGGVGEDCSPFVKDIYFPANKSLATFELAPSELFALSALNRPSRVCELRAEVVSGSFKGATAGYVRVNVIGSAATTVGMSSPEVGSYLEFGTVPVGAGGVRPLLLLPASGDFLLNKVNFVGLDSGRFGVVSATTKKPVAGGAVLTQAVQITASASGSPNEYVFDSPVNVASSADGGTSVQVSCNRNGGDAERALGDYEAEMIVTTDAGQLSYGVRCRAAHILNFDITKLRLDESGANNRADAILTLDSACRFTGAGECLRVPLREIAGTAVSGIDFETLEGDAVFSAGQDQVVIPIRVIGDNAVEGEESFGLEVIPPFSGLLVVSGNTRETVTIVDDDELTRALKVFLWDLPASGDPGETLPFRVAIHNRGNAALNGMKVEIAVEKPMQIRSFAILGASCSISTDKRHANCSLSGPLAPSMNGFDMFGEPLDEASLAADEADPSRWSDPDWKIVPGRLVTADMTRPPTIDVSGVISVSAQGGMPAAQASTKQALKITAPPLNATAGVFMPGSYLFLFALLLVRRCRQMTAGRKTGVLW